MRSVSVEEDIINSHLKDVREDLVTRVVDEITVASLTGRGGAAFPTGTKWAAVARFLP